MEGSDDFLTSINVRHFPGSTEEKLGKITVPHRIKFLPGTPRIRNMYEDIVVVKVKVKVSLEQATKIQRGSRCIALLFLQPRR